MTVHLVRLFIDDSQGNISNAVDNWVSNHPEWTDDPKTHELSTIENPDTGETYIAGNYRFTQEDTKTEILDDIEQRLSNIQPISWFRIGYHVCDHDEEEREGCSWDEKREQGTVPDYIPEIVQ